MKSIVADSLKIICVDDQTFVLVVPFREVDYLLAKLKNILELLY